MPHINQETAYEKFRALGRNSSHFVWFLTPLQFFEASNGWVFGYLKRGAVTLFALEPLIPIPGNEAAEFTLAWAEVEEALQPKISFFVSVYDQFLQILQERGFQSLQVGREPYVELANCIPTGKSGKGVRAARNQALRAGITVVEWAGEKIFSQPKLKHEMTKVLEQWRARKLIELGGFLNVVNPFEKMEIRRYFLATDKQGALEGFLVATPIPGAESYFLEDLVLRENSGRGAGELLTLEAMATLSESSAKFASLGVVSLTHVSKEDAHGLPHLAELGLVKIPALLARFYNVAGLETFRKRFKPQRWENVHLALRNHSRSGVSDNKAWLHAMLALLGGFAPKLNLSWSWPVNWVKHLLTKHPVSTIACLISALSFALVNHGGELPEWALRGFGFSGDSPLWQWYYRTITSDFLFFDFTHFA
ncbi:MAG: phosphatidylglycerol lysyltransferase domain-containing protein, partial [Bdellovibrionota bacterium]